MCLAMAENQSAFLLDQSTVAGSCERIMALKHPYYFSGSFMTGQDSHSAVT